MRIDSNNRMKLAELGKGIEESSKSSKQEIELDTNNIETNRVLEIVKNNGKLSVDNQITYMKYKGITFRHIDEEKAKEFLSQNTYYYKVTAFRKNIQKSKGKYPSLDFGLLNDLATIDMYLRYASIKFNLDTEHALKSLLVNTITDTLSEDGYTIVKEYDDYCREKILTENPNFDEKAYIPVDKKIMSRNKDVTGYHYDLFNKRKANPPIWVLIELMSFGELIRFIEFYYEKDKKDKNNFELAYKLLKYTKNFRDSAAHSRPLLLNVLNIREINATQEVTEYARNAGIDKLSRKNYITNKKIHDFICILMIHDHYIKSERMKMSRKKEVLWLIERCTVNSTYYQHQKEFSKVYEILCKVIDKYNP